MPLIIILATAKWDHDGGLNTFVYYTYFLAWRKRDAIFVWRSVWRCTAFEACAKNRLCSTTTVPTGMTEPRCSTPVRSDFIFIKSSTNSLNAGNGSVSMFVFHCLLSYSRGKRIRDIYDVCGVVWMLLSTEGLFKKKERVISQSNTWIWYNWNWRVAMLHLLQAFAVIVVIIFKLSKIKANVPYVSGSMDLRWTNHAMIIIDKHDTKCSSVRDSAMYKLGGLYSKSIRGRILSRP